MKIYFTATTSDISEEERKRYELIINTLEELGHRVIAEHVRGKPPKIHVVEETGTDQELVSYHRKLITWKHQAGLVVGEASHQSFRVGQEISYTLSQNKPVIALHEAGKTPLILRGIGADYLHVVEYTPQTLKKQLQDYIEYAKETADTRFNFFISSDIEAFLDWVSKERKVPRAVFLRQLIEDDLQKNRTYLREIGKISSKAEKKGVL